MTSDIYNRRHRKKRILGPAEPALKSRLERSTELFGRSRQQGREASGTVGQTADALDPCGLAAGADVKKRILFISRDLSPRGGGEGVAAWMLQALATEFDASLLCWTPPDATAVDRWYGTSLEHCRYQVQIPSRAQRWLVSRIPDTSGLQRANYLLRQAKRQPGYAVTVVCTSLESDLGRPGIQYIHYPYLGIRPWRQAIPGDAPPWKLARALASGHTAPWMVMSSYSFDRMRANLTLTNSEWTRAEIRRLFDMDSEVVYPPAPGQCGSLPWELRANAFVTIGRVECGKRFDWIIDVLENVRREAPEVELHVCAHVDPMWSGPRDRTIVEQRARKAGPWVRIHYDLSREELQTLLCAQRYGIHAKIDEHFGMAPAEIARAGAIPFVHDSGGQVEIVGRDSRLCFASAEDAVNKILTVMRNPALQRELQAEVRRRAERFSPEAFMQSILGQVDRFLSGMAIRAPR